jgi:hypothetical protein
MVERVDAEMSEQAPSEGGAFTSSPPDRQFDFWIGDWEVFWGESGRGSNHVQAVLDGSVILENFDGSPSIDLRGMSVSVYNPELGQWQQTWVDNQGNYYDFLGAFQDGKMILSREAQVDGRQLVQRMVWYNLDQDELDWNWERSDDGGKNWQILWQIHYRRRG